MLENITKEELFWFGGIYYLFYSIGGLYFMIKYIHSCKAYNVAPFNNSVWKGFFMLMGCGLFTQVALLFGTISAFVDIFRQKD
jgi:hypothetical protein